MKKSILLAIILFCCSVVFAQNELVVQSGDKGLYLSHTVSPKENFYSVGRLYNVPPKEIAAYNGLDMTHGLTIGQSIKIPLNKGNFSQAATKGRPVYYVVGANEGLYRVSVRSNNVQMANLRKWNHLSNDQVSSGKKLIVGYLVSPEAANIVQTNPEPAKKQPDVQDTNNDMAVVKQDPVEEKKEDPVKKQEPERKPEPPPAVHTVSSTTSQVVVNDGNGGYFKSQFDQQVRAQPLKTDQTATSGIFKTASGWQDSKFYVLIDHVEPGTIVKVINPTNNKAIYAKVLGEMSGIRQNQGYDLRMSNAAASALDITDTEKFIVRVNY